MANSIKINRLTNANIYADGSSLLGRAEEITLPVVNFKTAEHKALGMVGEMQYPSGIAGMEAKIKWNSFYKEVYKKFSNPFKGIKLQVRANLESYESGDRVEQAPVVCYLTVRPKENPLGAFKSQDNVELENTLTVSHFRLEIDGELITEVDVEANIWMVDGVDLLKEYRNNLGI